MYRVSTRPWSVTINEFEAERHSKSTVWYYPIWDGNAHKYTTKALKRSADEAWFDDRDEAITFAKQMWETKGNYHRNKLDDFAKCLDEILKFQVTG